MGRTGLNPVRWDSGRLPVGKARLHFGFDFDRIDIADDHDRRVVGAIIGFVIASQPLGRCRLDRVDQPDRPALRQACAGQFVAQIGLDRLIARRVAQPFFGQHDPAFGIHRRPGQQQSFADFAKQRQPGVERAAIGLGKSEHVDGFVLRGEGVGVGPKPQTLAFEHMHDFAIGNVGAAAKRHVFQIMRQPLLLIALFQRTRPDPQPHRHAIGRRVVVHDRIAQTIGQRAEPHRRIGRAPQVILRPMPGLLERRIIGQRRIGRQDYGKETDRQAKLHAQVLFSQAVSTRTISIVRRP